MIEVIRSDEPGRLIEAVRLRLRPYLNAEASLVTTNYLPPLFLVGPEVDVDEARAEVARYDLPEGTGVLMRTSGSTTGSGHIVCLSWDALVASARATAHALGSGPWMGDLPLHHIAGFQTIVRSLLAGTEPVLLTLKDEAGASAAITNATNANAPGFISLVPTQLRRVLNSPALTDAMSRATILVGGAASAPALLDEARAAGLTVVTSYGMTETCGGCVYDGYPIGSAAISIREGRICISGDVVALGYLGEPSSPAFAPGRMHLTNDAGTIDDGTLTVLGRLDDAITTGGLTVMPRLIEDAIARVAGVESVVVGVPDHEWGETTVAIVPRSLDTQNLRDAVRTLLGTGWQPRYVLTLAQLGLAQWPMTQSGKIHRRELARTTRVYFQRGNS